MCINTLWKVTMYNSLSWGHKKGNKNSRAGVCHLSLNGSLAFVFFFGFFSMKKLIAENNDICFQQSNKEFPQRSEDQSCFTRYVSLII